LEIYPTIPTTVIDTPIYAFDKLDGSNIRAEWSRKTGFSKFGTRKRLLDPSEKPFGEAVELFMNKYADDLEQIYRKQKFERTTAFFEFGGPNSFAGFHEQEEHDVVLFDLHVYRQGILPPKEFLKLFDNRVHITPVLFMGKPTQALKDKVRASTLKGMTFEGIVCKGGFDHRRRPIVFKMKSEAWFAKLRKKYGHDEALLQKLQ